MNTKTQHESPRRLKTASASQNRAIAKNAAETGLATLRPEDMPTKAQRRKWAKGYREAQDGALKLVGAINTLPATDAPEAPRAGKPILDALINASESFAEPAGDSI